MPGVFQSLSERTVLFKIFRQDSKEVFSLLRFAVLHHKLKALRTGNSRVQKDGKLFTEMEKILISQFVFLMHECLLCKFNQIK